MTYLKTKLQRDINTQTPLRFAFHLKNIRVNQRIVGCAGFVKNTDNGEIVYVNTEKSPYGLLSDKNLYRKANHLADYTGETTAFASDDDLPRAIIKMIS